MRRIALCVGMLAVIAAAVSGGGPAPASRPGPSRGGQESSAAPVVVVPDCRVRLMDEVTLSAERTGMLAEVAAEGAVVSAGQTVARLRDHLLRASLAIAEREAANEVEVRFARKASELAQLKYIRGIEANKSAAGAVSELELRELRLSAEKALLQIEQAEHQHQIARLRRDEAREILGTCQIESPLDAAVVEVFKKPGEVVREGEPILRLGSGGRVRAEGHVSIAEAARLRRGLAVEAVLDDEEATQRLAPPARLPGRLMLVDLKVEPVSRKVRVWAEIENARGLLRDGMMVSLNIPPRETERAGQQ